MDAIDQALRTHLKALIIKVCDVKGVTPEKLGDDDPMFASDGVLGLTSLDAIEIAVAIEREYKVKMKNVSSAREIFRSIATLSGHIRREADPAVLAKVVGVAAA
jgi:acyl carrier protein